MTKIKNIIYWATTVFLALGLFGTGIQQLMKVEAEGALGPPFAWGIVQLGYPVYILTILGTWKILAVLALLSPKFPLIKEWAYAGIFFLLTGALASHYFSGHPWYEFIPAVILLIFSMISWYFRPDDRRVDKKSVENNVTVSQKTS